MKNKSRRSILDNKKFENALGILDKIPILGRFIALCILLSICYFTGIREIIAAVREIRNQRCE